MAASLLSNFTTKGLVMSTSGGSTSFSSFVTQNSASAAAEDAVEEEIPVIDYSLLRTGTPNQRSQIIRDIGKACEQWGCFTLINHGVPESLRISTMEAFTEFFDLPVEERKEYMGKTMFEPIRHEMGITTAKDGEQYWRNFVRIFVHPNLHLPSKPLKLRAICEEFARQTREIGRNLLAAIGESLGLENSYMEKALDLANGHQILVGNQYPPSSQADRALGLFAHSDTPLLSIVMQNGGIHGLEVKHKCQWVPVQLIPGSFFIHSGDLLEIVSNGIYKSLLHRAMRNGNSTRMSVVTAVGVPLEKVVSPVPKLVEIADDNSVFPGITYLNFVELVKNNPYGKSALDLLKM